MREVWRDIKDYEGLYQISNWSNIRSLDRFIVYKSPRKGGKTIKGMPMKQCLSTQYIGFRISKNGFSEFVHTHRKLAIAFIPNPENKPCINHKDGNKLNNNLYNLEWVTYTENALHAYKIGLRKPNKKPYNEQRFSR